jgi:hypothetical protein
MCVCILPSLHQTLQEYVLHLQVFDSNSCKNIEDVTTTAYKRMGGFGPMKLFPVGLSVGLWGVATLSGNILAGLEFKLGSEMCGVGHHPLATLGFGAYGKSILSYSQTSDAFFT